MAGVKLLRLRFAFVEFSMVEFIGHLHGKVPIELFTLSILQSDIQQAQTYNRNSLQWIGSYISNL